MYRTPALLAGLFCFLQPLHAGPPDHGKKVVAYYAEWSIYGRKFNVGDIPADKLTHVIYAFARISEKGEVGLFDSYAAIDKFYPGDKWDAGFLRGNFHQLQQLKKKHPHLKTLIAVGGWTLSGPFSDVALTEAARVKFSRSAVEFMTKYGFDGIDIDWEYPVGGGLPGNKTRPEDKQNYTLLLLELRKQLHARGKTDKRSYLLTIAAPAGKNNYGNIELKKVADSIDWFNLMTYDFHGGWSPITHFNAPLYPIKADPGSDETVRKHFNVDSAVRGYLDAGVPGEKILLGVPTYGRGWGGVKESKDGLFQKPGAAPPGTWEAGMFDYKDLAANYEGKFQRFWHKETQVPWLYDVKKGIMISYDDPESLKIKAEYARTNGLGGVMIWEISADDKKSSLLEAINKGLKEMK